MHKLVIVLTLILCSSIIYAQNDKKLTSAQELAVIIVSKTQVPKIEYSTPPPPQYWNKGALTKFGLGQTSLTNWASGGFPTITFHTNIDAHIDYKKEPMFWENRLLLSYGFSESFEPDPLNNDKIRGWYKRSLDKFEINSKWGYSMFDKIYFTSLLNFRTQLTQGFNNSKTTPQLLSNFMSPAYITLGLGIDYKPFDGLSLNMSPVTGKLNIVSNDSLRTMYGNAIDQPIKSEFGAQLVADYKKTYKSFNIKTVLTLFSDYLDSPENIAIRWDLDASFKITKFYSVSLSTALIYDDKVLIADQNGVSQPRVQFQETFNISFEFTFGNYQKAK